MADEVEGTGGQAGAPSPAPARWAAPDRMAASRPPLGYRPPPVPAQGFPPPSAYPSGPGRGVAVMAVPAAPARGEGLPPPVAMQAVPGTPFAIAMVRVAPTVSGPAVASLVTGIGSMLVSLIVICFGALGAQDGWGPMVAGAFAVLAGVLGAAGVGLGLLSVRQIKRRGSHHLSGRGMALTGMVCGAVGLVLTALAMVLAVSLSV